MKFRDIYNILKENEIGSGEFYFANGTIECSLDAKRKLKKILEIPAFKNYPNRIEEIFISNDFIKYNYDNVLNKNTYNEVLYVRNLAFIYVENFEALYPKLDEYSISIKLPNNNNIGMMGKIFEKVDTILNQVLIFPEINSNIKIKNFDNGSYWLDITLGSLAAVTLVSSLTYSAAYIFKEKKKLRLIEIEYQKANMQKEHLDGLIVMNKKLIKSYVEKEANNLINNNYNESKEDKELMGRVMNSIERLSKLIEEGAEIHPALEVSNEIKHEFPDLRYLENLTSKVKEIESK